ncbi:HlyD family efflux transporter periplasmic adaptor subunit [Muricauda oceani]|uniref:HlyD family efflux transporter periplasmic adaptor subunit n=1 Tax=Flagellimonas oceani TaxID=2698672 RepID=A0A6G7J5A3_9FLAO|nr:HlyD family efflux transporter periplasmic adaptor subunit [Allomuricauda oceani]MBW8243558.1 HlyD family efflux transporter periplasmic adaptor subunit [Allomuricauda oceani]QII45768.1 HlyD family efflux transporter periplasmic adaptor subunit [Allomuricauda oceani]
MEKVHETKFNIRSESVQEILGRVPNAFIRWGNTIILFLILGILILSSVIHYPIVLEGNFELVPNAVAKEVHAPISGTFIKWTGKNGLLVEDGERLGFISGSQNTVFELNSPQSGSLLVDPYLKEGNYVNKGDLLFKILLTKPTDYNLYFTVNTEPPFDAIKEGQHVQLKIYVSDLKHVVFLGNIGNISSSKTGAYEFKILANNLSSNSISKFLGKKYKAEIEIDNPKLIKYFFSSSLDDLELFKKDL